MQDQPTPAWLTAVLQGSGVLTHGAVTAVERSTSGAFNSHTSYLRLRYSADATPEAPTRVVLKRNIAEAWGVEAGAEEVKFYTAVAGLADHPPITIPCYVAAYDHASGQSYLLLQDLSDTHKPPITRDQQIDFVEGVPPAVYIEAVVDTLARLHAYWWQHPLLDSATFSVGYWSRDAERFGQYLQRRRTAWESLVSGEGDWLPADLRELYTRLLDRLPYHWERYLAPRFQTKTNLTLVHGDAYFANFLCPKDPGAGATYLLDWQSPVFDLAGYDLVNLCATFWTPELRHEESREVCILQRYYTALCAHGVQGYSWEDFEEDYRSGLIYWLLVPLQDRYDGSRKDYWWPKMQCLAAAFRDWRCSELLEIA